MKRKHSYYRLNELLERRWQAHDLSISELLKFAAEDELQLSVILHPDDMIGTPIDYTYNDDDGYEHDCHSDYIDSTMVLDIPQRIAFQMELKFTNEGMKSKFNIGSIFSCRKQKCSYPKKFGCGPEFEGDISCSVNDLLITHENVLRFERKLPGTEELPPYLDPENEFYSVTLDLAVKGWKAIFEDHNILHEKSPAKSVAKYLLKSDDMKQRFEDKYGEVLTSTMAESIGRIATGQYSSNKGRAEWNKYIKTIK